MRTKTVEECQKIVISYNQNYKAAFGSEPSKDELKTRLEAEIEKKKEEMFLSMFGDQNPETLNLCIENIPNAVELIPEPTPEPVTSVVESAVIPEPAQKPERSQRRRGRR